MMFQIGHDIIKRKWLSLSVNLVTISMLSFMIDSALAITLDAGVLQTIETRSNLHHVPEDAVVGPREEIISTSSVYLKFNEDTSDLKSNVDLNVSYIDFKKNESPDVIRNSLKADALWQITRGHYSWFFMDNISQTRVDSLISFSESNTQNVNEFVTGPKLEWDAGNSTIKLNVFLSTYDYSVTADDTTSIVSDFDWIRSVSAGIKMSLKYTAKVVSYDEVDTLSDYDQSTLGLRFEYKKTVDELDVFFGKTILNNDAGEKYTSTSVNYKKQISRNSSISLSYSNNLSDKNDAIDSLGTSLIGVYIDKKYSIIYQKFNTSSGFNVKYEEERKEQEASTNEEQQRSATVSAYKSISSRSRMNISYSDKYNSLLGFEDYTYITSLAYQKKFNNKMSISFFVSEVLLESSDPLRQYTDQRIGLSLSISR